MAPVAEARQEPLSPSHYFRRTPLLLMFLIGGINAYHAWAFFAPQTIPFDKLGLIGVITKYILENYNTPLRVWFVMIWILHTAYAFWGLKICKDKDISDGKTQFLWFAQTVAFGLGSLFFLWIYRPPKKKQ
ncbi:transmembrane protein 254-like [Sceloporus undulatus]|uniref:transmembrane protein 254-like n=1 Tax=Sceloporus undulatus TaxID=8520 RepID=UPI001C4B72E4|nr:transmembrane protein 254-like [Sceloporus undulatus]